MLPLNCRLETTVFLQWNSHEVKKALLCLYSFIAKVWKTVEKEGRNRVRPSCVPMMVITDTALAVSVFFIVHGWGLLLLFHSFEGIFQSRAIRWSR